MKESKQHRIKTTYADAGVDIAQAERVIRSMLPVMQRTVRSGAAEVDLGFGAQFELPLGYERPVLVSGTDGVGTKLKIAFEIDRHDTIGIDLVAMCVNDVVVQGAKPLFFLDYFATGKLQKHVVQGVIQGIAHGCEEAQAALIGGETAEMPEMYAQGEYDLAGFCVGIAEKSEIIDGSQIEAGNVVIGIASSGVHSNGFSLVRKLLRDSGVELSDYLDRRSFGETLLTPTRIYVRPLLEVIDKLPIAGLAHITGGGITANVKRILPPGVVACLRKNAWPSTLIFDWLQSASQLSDEEMLGTFNCGIGMVIFARPQDEAAIHKILRACALESFSIGEVKAAAEPTQAVQWI